MNTSALTHLRNSIGISILWILPPFIYFIKELFGFSGTPIFTGLLNIFGLLLMINQTNLKVAYKVNPYIAFWGISFFILTLIYFFLFNSHSFSFYFEIINLGVSFLYFILLLRVSNETQTYLILIIFLSTLLINLVLIYSVLSNPEYVIGSRATVQFNREGDTDYTGNPYIYSKNGFLGFVISFLIINLKPILQKKYTLFTKLILHFNLSLSFVVIILTQTRATFLALVLVMLLLIIFVLNFNRQLFTFSKTSFFYYGFILFILKNLNNKFNVFELLSNYFDNYVNLIQKALLTGFKLGNVSEKDVSAMGRVKNIEYFLNEWKFNSIDFIFGHGYRYKYMDIPLLESFLNFGIFGFLLFACLNITILYFSIKSLKSGHIFQVFLGLIYFHTFISIFTAGRPTDLPYWITYFLLIRYLGVIEKPIKSGI